MLQNGFRVGLEDESVLTDAHYVPGRAQGVRTSTLCARDACALLDRGTALGSAIRPLALVEVKPSLRHLCRRVP